jgi:hypothetical protein
VTAARTAGAVEISSSGEGGEGDYARAEAADEWPSLLHRKILMVAIVLVAVLVYVKNL